MKSGLLLAALPVIALSGCIAVFPVTVESPPPVNVENAGPLRQTVEIGPEIVPCQGAFPQQCLVVDGQFFYDQIEGFSHQAGTTSVVEIERTRRCDPSVPNACPQDVGIYSYRLIRVISER